MKVILVRHAETEWNSRGIIQGREDSALTKHGQCQTAALLQAFAENGYEAESVYASPLGRTWNMGQVLAKHFRCSLVAEATLKEQAFGQLEGMSAEQFKKNHQDEANALFELDAEYCPPGGESLTQASRRIIDFLINLEKSGHYNAVCIVSHGHVSQGVLAILCDGNIDQFARYAHPNASYSVFDIKNGRCETIRWGIATHLRHLKC
ncbi:histidine phosphatase family protein [Tatumella terrea]|uniref:Histidine phosphatase family protein n=1 Tax=Tatumella terrea TaxID=419007 RepID=A0ABW1W001_9GAMM